MNDYEQLIREARSLQAARRSMGHLDVADSIEVLTDAVETRGREVAELRATIEACRPVVAWAENAVDVLDCEPTAAEDAAMVQRARDALAAVPASSRRVETTEELDALPIEAVIRDARGIVHERWNDGWTQMGLDYQDYVEAHLPATILWLPADGEAPR